jgi:hypothetical protein
MRLKQVYTLFDPVTAQDIWYVRAVDQGIEFVINVLLPGNWDTLTRDDKIAWVMSYVADHLTTHKYAAPHEIVFPLPGQIEDAKDAFDDLPGWASWTGQEAAAWIDTNVTDLASAKTVLQNMARAIMYLRDIVIER